MTKLRPIARLGKYEVEHLADFAIFVVGDFILPEIGLKMKMMNMLK